MPSHRQYIPANDQQRGFVLVMALVLLVLLTILGITALNTTSLQQKMVFNLKEKTLSTQAAESAMELAQKWLQNATANGQSLPIDNDNTTDGLHGSEYDDSTHKATWNSLNWDSDSDIATYPNTPDGTPPIGTPIDTSKLFSSRPQYIIEYLGAVPCSSEKLSTKGGSPDCAFYRITARGFGGNRSAVTVLQSTVKVRTGGAS
jgi:type IV pilus assembly protein PilX